MDFLIRDSEAEGIREEGIWAADRDGPASDGVKVKIEETFHRAKARWNVFHFRKEPRPAALISGSRGTSARTIFFSGAATSLQASTTVSSAER